MFKKIKDPPLWYQVIVGNLLVVCVIYGLFDIYIILKLIF